LGYFVHILLALLAQALAESGQGFAWEAPWAVALLCAVPYALGRLTQHFYVRGRLRAAERCFAALHGSAPLLHALALLACGWLRTVERVSHARADLLAWPHPVLLLGLAPFAVYSLLAIDARARIGSSTRRDVAAYRRFHVRMLLSGLLPMTLFVLISWLVGLSECVRVSIEEVALWNAVFVVGLMTLFALCLPWFLRHTWETSPLGAGPQRSVLDVVAAHAGFRCRELLVWHTGNSLANAAVVGLFPRQRLVLFSDALLAQLSLRELVGVFAHEIGHAKRHHVLVFGAWTLSLLLGADLVAHAASGESELAASALFLAGLGLWYFGFGWLSRRFELEADLYSLRLSEDPEGLMSALETVGGPHGRQRRGWRHFSTAQRVEFLREVSLDPARGERLARKLRWAARLGFVLCAMVVLLQARALAGTWSKDHVSVALRLGRYGEALERVARGADLEPEPARLVERARALGFSNSRPTAGELETLARGALARGEVELAFDLLLLGARRGRDDMGVAAEALEAWSDGRIEDARDLSRGEPAWSGALEPVLANPPPVFPGAGPPVRN
jgi:Zn-dependent protease with chaperone function